MRADSRSVEPHDQVTTSWSLRRRPLIVDVGPEVLLNGYSSNVRSNWIGNEQIRALRTEGCELRTRGTLVINSRSHGTLPGCPFGSGNISHDCAWGMKVHQGHEGHLASQITAPTLIGDGRQDVILPAPNSDALARTIHHALLKLYPDTGHGFLVQHELDWIAAVNHFLRG